MKLKEKKRKEKLRMQYMTCSRESDSVINGKSELSLFIDSPYY